ncbi:hypothetical protein CMV_021482 [Castanea mollissima]|uniref:Uncharacterized protein n=1 Tax=Castanea mollissima TaxID=60419 RepID=A0A8J4QL79_9ROSI|nr:hypothetical protein CMV_021482 [Castanea mollissima]
MGGDKPNTSLWVQVHSERVNVNPQNTDRARRHHVPKDMAFLKASSKGKTSSEPTNVNHHLSNYNRKMAVTWQRSGLLKNISTQSASLISLNSY